jgi:hypothetical protein
VRATVHTFSLLPAVLAAFNDHLKEPDRQIFFRKPVSVSPWFSLLELKGRESVGRVAMADASPDQT